MAQQSPNIENGEASPPSEEGWGTTADSLLKRFGTTDEERNRIHATRLRLHSDEEVYRWAKEVAKACGLTIKELLTAVAILAEDTGHMDTLLWELQQRTDTTPVKFIKIELEDLRVKLTGLLKMAH